jgi:catechol 2,3-dioxygenase-like lactoylglutathione lyase family enzyme
MIKGSHLIIYSSDAEADRAFFRDILQLKSVDAGDGWLIFKLPPAELGIHPSDDPPKTKPEMAEAQLYLMCDDLHATIASLQTKQLLFTPIREAGWGITTTLSLPSGAQLGLYQPRHPTAIES